MKNNLVQLNLKITLEYSPLSLCLKCFKPQKTWKILTAINTTLDAENG